MGLEAAVDVLSVTGPGQGPQPGTGGQSALRPPPTVNTAGAPSSSRARRAPLRAFTPLPRGARTACTPNPFRTRRTPLQPGAVQDRTEAVTGIRPGERLLHVHPPLPREVGAERHKRVSNQYMVGYGSALVILPCKAPKICSLPRPPRLGVMGVLKQLISLLASKSRIVPGPSPRRGAVEVTTAGIQGGAGIGAYRHPELALSRHPPLYPALSGPAPPTAQQRPA